MAVVDASGNVCGTASPGGPSGFYGTVWEFSGGMLLVVHSFEYTDGANYFAGLAVGKHGEFVGTAEKDVSSRSRIVLAGSLANFRITHASITNLRRTDQPFGFGYSFESDGYAKNAGNLLLAQTW